MANPLDSLPPKVVEALRRGDKIGAIKLLREVARVGLAEAKTAIDAANRTPAVHKPDHKPAPAASRPHSPPHPSPAVSPLYSPGLSPGEVPRTKSGAWKFVGLAFVALVAWQAVSAYQAYLIRAKVHEVLQSSAALKAEVDRQLAKKGTVDIRTMPALSQYTASMHVTPQGEIVMRLKPDVADGATISWKRVKLVGGEMVWDCGGDLPAKYWPASCRGLD